jgi:hypothetical protein
MLRLAVAVFLGSILSGCFPVTVQDVPTTEGVLVLIPGPEWGAHAAESAPAAGVDVWQVPSNRPGACDARNESGTTDAEGRFRLAGSTHLTVLPLLPVDRSHDWSFCVRSREGAIFQWHPIGLSPPYAPAAATLRCTLRPGEIECDESYRYE